MKWTKLSALCWMCLPELPRSLYCSKANSVLFLRVETPKCASPHIIRNAVISPRGPVGKFRYDHIEAGHIFLCGDPPGDSDLGVAGSFDISEFDVGPDLVRLPRGRSISADEVLVSDFWQR